MSTLYSAYRKRRLQNRRYADGGIVDPNAVPDLSSAADAIVPGAGSIMKTANSLLSPVVDAIDKPDPLTGLQSPIGSAIKGNLKGGFIGGIMGLTKGIKAQRQARGMLASQAQQRNAQAENLGNARMVSDPTLYQGYRNSEYYALGGVMTGDEDPKKPASTASTPTALQPRPEGTYQTQSEVNSANTFARGFAERNRLKGDLISPQDVYVARKPGDPIVPIVTKGPQVIPRTLPKIVPNGIQASDLQNDGRGNYSYTDPQTGDLVEVDPSVVNLPRFRQTPVATQQALALRTKAAGGFMKKAASFGQETGEAPTAPITRMFMNGGSAKSLSSYSAEMKGPSHESGGIQIPEMGAEVEGGETTAGDFVFSKRLGFADQHRPIARAIGKIERKPLTKDRVNAVQRLKEREGKLALSQEFFKAQMGIQ